MAGSIMYIFKLSNISTKETKLERADFPDGCSELLWSERALPILA